MLKLNHKPRYIATGIKSLYSRAVPCYSHLSSSFTLTYRLCSFTGLSGAPATRPRCFFINQHSIKKIAFIAYMVLTAQAAK